MPHKTENDKEIAVKQEKATPLYEKSFFIIKTQREKSSPGCSTRVQHARSSEILAR